MKKVLVVDDIAYSRLLYGKTMKKMGFQICEAGDGEAAFSQARNGEFDLILLDLNLPDINGVEVLLMLRQNGIETPIIVITANEDKNVVIQLTQLGIKDYLIKPVDVFELQKRVMKVLGITRRSPAPAAAAAGEEPSADGAAAAEADEGSEED